MQADWLIDWSIRRGASSCHCRHFAWHCAACMHVLCARMFFCAACCAHSRLQLCMLCTRVTCFGAAREFFCFALRSVGWRAGVLRHALVILLSFLCRAPANFRGARFSRSSLTPLRFCSAYLNQQPHLHMNAMLCLSTQQPCST